MNADLKKWTRPTCFLSKDDEEVEEGLALAPKFDGDGLIPCLTTDWKRAVLMLGYMNGEGRS